MGLEKQPTIHASIIRTLQQVNTYEYQIREVARAALSWIEDTQEEIAEAKEKGEEVRHDDERLLLWHDVYLRGIIHNEL